MGSCRLAVFIHRQDVSSDPRVAWLRLRRPGSFCFSSLCGTTQVGEVRSSDGFMGDIDTVQLVSIRRRTEHASTLYSESTHTDISYGYHFQVPITKQPFFLPLNYE